MPYTPPSRRSPASSNSSSPAITRTHSYDKSLTSPSRPELPRSRSATYLQKHRRTPSLSDPKSTHHECSGGVSYSDGSSTVSTGSTSMSRSKSILKTGLTMSPVDAGSSEEDEDRGRSRQIAYLAESLRDTILSTKRQRSPNRAEGNKVQMATTGSSTLVLKTSSSSLTPENIKIVHSRSNSDMLSVPQNQISQSEQSSPGSPGDSDEEGLVMKRVPLLRKKSGELVKPALRASSRKRPVSAPGTPTYPKNVHFHENIEQVRHFLQIDKPMAVSAESSPVETYESESDYPFGAIPVRKARSVEWEIKLENFPKETHERKCLPVRVEQLSLASDGKSLIGIVAVANIAFQKWVYARFTYDYWKTTSEIAAEWTNVRPAGTSDGYDRFQFVIRLSEQANLQNKTLFICVRYNAGGQEHWDNNSGHNYQVDFLRKVPKPNKSPSPSGPSPGAVPRSRRTTPNSLPRPRSFPVGSSDDEFSTRFDSPFRLKNKLPGDRSKNHTFHDPTAQHHSANRLSNRYDFTSSLTAALATAQNALGDRSGLKPKTTPTAPRHLTAPVQAKAPIRVAVPVPAPAPRPIAASIASPPPIVTPTPTPMVQALQTVVNAARPMLGSAEYQALIQKFCYFGSGGNNSAEGTAVGSPEAERQDTQTTDVQKTEQTEQMEQTEAVDSSTDDSSANSTATNSPQSPNVQLHQTEATPSEPSKPSTRTPSPSIRALSPHLLPYRSPSPAHSAYQEFPHQGLSVQSAQC